MPGDNNGGMDAGILRITVSAPSEQRRREAEAAALMHEYSNARDAWLASGETSGPLWDRFEAADAALLAALLSEPPAQTEGQGEDNARWQIKFMCEEIASALNLPVAGPSDTVESVRQLALWAHGRTASQADEVRKALAWIGEFAVAHHGEQPLHVLLHALTVDIPHYVEETLRGAAPEGQP